MRISYLLCFLAFGTVFADETPPFSHDALNRVLRKFVDAEGRVNYGALKRESGDLDACVAQLAKIGPGTHPGLFPTRQDSMAYWINAYNALVLKGVVAAYPVKSVRDIALFYGFFKRHTFDVDGRQLTLDNIEHDILRPVFGDPRIHAAINCAAVSCPRLRQEAFVPALLDAQLDAAIREMVAIHVRLDREGGVLYLSKIFDWFSSDFTTWYAHRHQVEKATLSDYVRLYMPEADRQYLAQHPNIKIAFFDYDWSLNDAKGDR